MLLAIPDNVALLTVCSLLDLVTYQLQATDKHHDFQEVIETIKRKLMNCAEDYAPILESIHRVTRELANTPGYGQVIITLCKCELFLTLLCQDEIRHPEILETKTIIRRAREERNTHINDALDFFEYVRPELRQFISAIENVMRKHDPIKGDSYKTIGMAALDEKLIEEYTEYREARAADDAVAPGTISKKTAGEILDFSAVASMLWYREGK